MDCLQDKNIKVSIITVVFNCQDTISRTIFQIGYEANTTNPETNNPTNCPFNFA